MIEIALTISLLTIFLLIRLEKGAILFFALLPFHALTKNLIAFFLGGGGLFSFWKELAVIIMIAKLINMKPKYYINQRLLFVVGIYLVLMIYYFLISGDYWVAMSSLRNNLFIFLILLLYSQISLSTHSLKLFYKVASFVFLISYFGGYIQLFLLKIPLGFLMGRIVTIDSSGYVTYSTNSARIEGYERMSGLIGGPNDFGMFVAISILILFSVWISVLNKEFSSRYKVFMVITMSIGGLALILSFSRAGWFLFLAGSLMIAFINNIKIQPIIVGILLLLAIGVISIYMETNYIYEIYESTVSGRELSVAHRFSNFASGVVNVLKEPFGHGLGSTDNRYSSVHFFAESAYVNLIYEVGVISFLTLSLIYLLLIRRSYRLMRRNEFASLAYATLILMYSVSFISINTYGMPFIYISWIVVGMGINNNIVRLISFLKLKDELISNPEKYRLDGVEQQIRIRGMCN